ncbi:hypothetical protein ICN33_06005 [Polynucleobacter sp. UB-Tiil-W10]|nr:hypothetical protein [Polynucleobacter sp. UB-Tiil-W10]
MGFHFCTLFDSNYLIKGVTMIRSLQKYCPSASIYVLCMDTNCEEVLSELSLTNVHLIPLSDLEDSELLQVKKQRGVAEYCWTLSPCLPYYVLEKYQHVEFITYLDADLFFYSSLEPLFQEIGRASIAIIEHRFTSRLKDQEIKGRFCVEWVSFRRDTEGLACLKRWREQCIEWCFYRLEEGKMGDQKYLDPWPEQYANCHILMHQGAGIAPWNYPQYLISGDANSSALINGDPLIFYHFHQFQILENGKFDRLSSFYTEEAPAPDLIYSPYESAINETIGTVHLMYPNFLAGFKSSNSVFARRFAQKFLPSSVKRFLQKFMRY